MSRLEVESPGRPARKRSESFSRIFWRRFRRNRLAVTGFLVLLVLYSAAAFAPQLAPYDPNAIELRNKLAPPSGEHPMGTDLYGRDVFSRVVYGSRISLSVGFVAVSISVTVGSLLGAVAGYYGGVVDNVIMRIVDVVISFPVLFLVLTVMAMLGTSIFNIMLVIGLTSWTTVARLVRGEFLSLREREFAEAARASGAGSARIIFKHILPNAGAPIIVAATLGVAYAILTETGLSYLGLGVQPPTASWGNMLYEGQNYFRQAWWIAVYPGLAIFVTVLCLNMVGDGLRDALDPRLKD